MTYKLANSVRFFMAHLVASEEKHGFH